MGQLRLIRHLELSKGGGGAGLGTGDVKGQEGNVQGDGKADVWEVNVCWAIFNSGTQRGL